MSMTAGIPDRPKKSLPWAMFAIVFLILTLWLAIQLGLSGRRHQAEVKKLKESYESQLAKNEERLLQNAAQSFAIGSQPLFLFQGLVPQIDNAVMQQLCARLVQENGWEYATLLNAEGVVIASSDLALIGKVQSSMARATAGFEKKDKSVEIVQPIESQGARLGTAILKISSAN